MSKRKTKTRRRVEGFVLDLHGKRVAEAIHVLDLELNQHFVRGGVTGRVVCGHGTGALLKAVNESLLHHPLVRNHSKSPDGGSYSIELHSIEGVQ